MSKRGWVFLFLVALCGVGVLALWPDTTPTGSRDTPPGDVSARDTVADGAGPGSGSARITRTDLENTRDRFDLWVHYSRDYNGQRYSPDTQLNRDTVGQLELKWQMPVAYNFSGFETTALVFDDQMFLTDGRGLIKVDPQSGADDGQQRNQQGRERHGQRGDERLEARSPGIQAGGPRGPPDAPFLHLDVLREMGQALG